MKTRVAMKFRIARVRKAMAYKAKYMKQLLKGKRYHIHCMDGNSKTGKQCRTVSLISGHDCRNCRYCFGYCYDINNVLYIPDVQRTRGMNSALHEFNPEWYWEDIENDIKENFTQQQRINVGGDSTYEDFCYMEGIAKRNPKCDLLVFTRNYDWCNQFLDERDGVIPSNLQIMWSRDKNLPSNNKWQLPEAHILFDDGTTTAPEYGSVYCGGNCSYCHFNNEGCWSLKRGESVIFKAH